MRWRGSVVCYFLLLAAVVLKWVAPYFMDKDPGLMTAFSDPKVMAALQDGKLFIFSLLFADLFLHFTISKDSAQFPFTIVTMIALMASFLEFEKGKQAAKMMMHVCAYMLNNKQGFLDCEPYSSLLFLVLAFQALAAPSVVGRVEAAKFQH